MMTWFTNTCMSHLNETHQLIEATYESVNGIIIASINGLSPVQHQAIIWTNAGL